MQLSNIKQLAGQTVWYGLSSIAARFINYLLTPYLTYSLLITTADYGRMGTIYSAISLFNIIFTYGMETAYFRFIQRKEVSQQVNDTATISLLISTIFFGLLLWFNQSFLAEITRLQDFPLLIKLSIFIIALDALSAIPFARLRNEGRPKRFAFIRITGIAINVGLTVFFLSYCSRIAAKDPDSWASLIYHKDVNPIVYVLIANLIQSAFTLVLLSKWLLPKQWKFNTIVWKEMIVYALPMLIAGMGGMVNETFDRLMLGWWLPGTNDYHDQQRGIYNACYKLSILITLFIQAFRMGAEPFFFKHSNTHNPKPTYARVMKFFVITITVMFLVVSLFIPVWKYFISERYWAGLSVVPILLLANMCLGIYYNLSVWYKITNHTMAGAWITLMGTAITIAVNWLFIPRYSYMACAWATFFCYSSMMVISFVWGQRNYFIPYDWKKLLAYILIVVVLFFVHNTVTFLWQNTYFSISFAAILTLCYMLVILKIERNEFSNMPVIGRLINKNV